MENKFSNEMNLKKQSFHSMEDICFDSFYAGADLGGGCRGCAPSPEMTCGFLIQLVFCKKKTMWFIGVEVEQETSAPPPKKNPGSAPVMALENKTINMWVLGKEKDSIFRVAELKSGGEHEDCFASL